MGCIAKIVVWAHQTSIRKDCATSQSKRLPLTLYHGTNPSCCAQAPSWPGDESTPCDPSLTRKGAHAVQMKILGLLVCSLLGTAAFLSFAPSWLQLLKSLSKHTQLAAIACLPVRSTGQQQTGATKRMQEAIQVIVTCGLLDVVGLLTAAGKIVT